MALTQKYSEDAEFLHIFLSVTLQIAPSGCTFSYFSCQKVMKYWSAFRKKIIYFPQKCLLWKQVTYQQKLLQSSSELQVLRKAVELVE